MAKLCKRHSTNMDRNPTDVFGPILNRNEQYKIQNDKYTQVCRKTHQPNTKNLHQYNIKLHKKHKTNDTTSISNARTETEGKNNYYYEVYKLDSIYRPNN